MPRIEIVPFTPGHYMALLQSGTVQGSASLSRAEQAARIHATGGPAYTALIDGWPAGAAGLLLYPWSGAAYGWSMLALDGRPHIWSLWRALHRGLAEHVAALDLRRIETFIPEWWSVGHRWLTHLGFVHEGDMKQYGASGETYSRYALFPQGA